MKLYTWITILGFIILHVLSVNAKTVSNERLAIENEYGRLEYSFSNPYVKLNPFGLNSLAALVKFSTQKDVQITVTVKGKNGAPDVTHTFKGFKTEHEINVLGLYPNHENKIILTAADKNGQKQTTEITIKTPKSNKRALFVPLIKNQSEQNRYYFITEGIVFDEFGNLRFDFKNGDMTYYLGGELISESRNFGLKRYSMSGELLQEYPYPQGFTSFTHGMAKKPNGNFLILGSLIGKTAQFENKEQATQRDIIIELDYKTGAHVKTWDLANVMNPDRSVIIRSATQSYGLNNWCHLNGVSYDSDDTSLVLSCRHNGMIKIDDETGDLIWVFGPKLGYEKSGRDGKGPAIFDKVLTAVNKNGQPYDENFQMGKTADTGFKWPTKTHDARAYGNQIFSIFDNSGSLYDKTLYATPYSVASIFKVDPIAMTVKQIWRTDLDDYSQVGSSVLYDPNQKEVVVFISQIEDDEQNGISYGKILRYDFNTQALQFEGLIYRGGNTHFYRLEPFEFYKD